MLKPSDYRGPALGTLLDQVIASRKALAPLRQPQEQDQPAVAATAS